MQGRFRLTAAVTVLLCGAYVVYDFGVDQLLGEDHAQTVPVAPVENIPAALDDAARVARSFLTEHSWAEDAEIQLRDGKRLFYFSQRWSETDTRREVRFEPFAVVWFSDGQEQPLTIVAETALVTFDADVDLSNPEPGRVIGGELTGAVSIRGPQQLKIDGRHFIYSEKAASIWSDDAVTFEYADNRDGKTQSAQGYSDHGIQIDLDVESAPSSGHPLAIGSIREIQLRRKVEVEFKFQQQDRTIPLTVACTGRFSLAMDDHETDPKKPMTATFEDEVLVRRAWPDHEPDTLACDQLQLFLDTGISTVNASDTVAGTPAQTPPENDIQLRWLRATGRRVVLKSPRDQLTAVMAKLDYDPASGRVILNNLQSSPVDSQALRQNLIHLPRVDATIDGSRLQCQQITLLHDDDDNIREVICSGRGLLQHRQSEPVESSGTATDSTPEQISLTAQWQRQLRLYPDSDSQLDIIELSGGAVLRVPGENAAVSADFIRVWVDRLHSMRKPDNGHRPLPHRMLAQHGVILDSPQMSGKTETLQVWFERAAARVNTSDASVPSALTGAAAGRTTAAARDTRSVNADTAPSGPVRVTSRLIRVRMVQHGSEASPELAEVWSEGNVEIISPRESNLDPTVLTGQKLHLKNRSDTGQIIHVYGSPARIADPSLSLTGNEIFADREKNLVWVDGEGSLSMPVDRGLDGQLLKKTDRLKITWNEQMAFDGLVATIVGRVSASVLQSSMRCQQMDVTMTERILFQKSDRSVTTPEVETVVCRYRVEVDSHRVEEGTVNEVIRARFAAFAMQQSTGRAEARGPGFVKMWRRGRGKRAALAPVATGRANQGANADATAWEYTRIDFANEMLGQQDARSMKFLGQVQVVYGPVSEPLEIIDLETLPKDGGAMYCDLLDFTQRLDQASKNKNETIELLAQGNSRLEGHNFFAQAYEISFAETKGLYTLRSQGDQQAMLWRQARPGGKRTPVVAKTFRFIPSKNYVDFDNASLVQGFQ